MNNPLKNLLILPALIAALGWLPTVRVSAQTFTVIHSFTNKPDGAEPWGGLTLVGNTLYGTTYAGGTNGHGMIFAVNVSGGGFTNLYSFTGGSDGAEPQAGLLLVGSTLYGTAASGGSNGFGTVYAINTNGTGFKLLHTFNGSTDGENPESALILGGNTLYGTTEQGGGNNSGTVFSLNTAGTVFANLYDFTGGDDGAYPVAGVALAANTLYGTTILGGAAGNGTVYSVGTGVTDFQTVHGFSSLSGGYYGDNGDGIQPDCVLLVSDGTLYGTATSGGINGNGNLFAINATDFEFTNIYSFTAVGYPVATNSDGADPFGGLILSGSTLYGTSTAGGTNGNGTVFAMNVDGSNSSFTVLHTFTTTEVARPNGSLIISGTTLYGTAEGGGSGRDGTIFSLSLAAPSAPTLGLQFSGTNVILTWAAAGYTLQSTTNLASPAVWTPVSGQNAVTNPISGTQEFYRLSQ